MPPKKVPRKRGRKASKTTTKVKLQDGTGKKVHRKRGRKPKGGKIVKHVDELNNATEAKKPNIILQLKCSSKDLVGKDIFLPMNASEGSDVLSYSVKSSVKQAGMTYKQYDNISYKLKSTVEHEYTGEEDHTEWKEIWDKLRMLKLKLHLNEVSDKRSNCFWCTCPFDNPPVYIPKQERNSMVEVYGCFCSPECAVAYLKEEPIDCSVLWERYALLNNIYGKIYDYEKSIKPAPNPYYTLDKYYGNLTIQEYRKLLSKDRLLLVVDKPLTKILPELYEENNELPTIFNDLLSSNSLGKPSQYRLQRNRPGNSKIKSLNKNFRVG